MNDAEGASAGGMSVVCWAGDSICHPDKDVERAIIDVLRYHRKTKRIKWLIVPLTSSVGVSVPQSSKDKSQLEVAARSYQVRYDPGGHNKIVG